MDVEGAKDAIPAKKMEKVTMRKKKREAKAVPELAGDDQLNELEKKKKKDKRKAEDCTKESGDKAVKSSALDCTIQLPILVKDGTQYDKTENRKKKENRNVSEKAEKRRKREKNKGKGPNDVEKNGDSESIAVEIVNNLTNADTNVSEKGEKKHKREKNKAKDPKDGDIESSSVEHFEKLTNADTNVSEKVEKKKRKREKNKDKCPNDGDKRGDSESTAVESVGKLTNADTNVNEKGEKKHKREKNKGKDHKDGKTEGDIESSAVKYFEKLTNADTIVSEKVEKNKRKREKNNVSEKVEKKKRKREKNNVSEKVEKKKRKREKNKSKDLTDGEKEGNKMSNDEDTNAIETNSKDSKPTKKKKKVSFSNHDDVFPVEGGMVQGKRFTPEEDEMVKQAVFDYIDVHGLGENGLDMVLHCQSHPKLKYCWKEIGEALPYRPFLAVYDRAHSLFERSEIREWTDDEIEIIKKFHAEHGPKWKQLADAMGKHRRHVKDAWRRTRLSNTKKGQWSQEEYQNLFDLVNVDLRAKVNEEKKSKYGMLRDNISWSAISDKLASRSFISCCVKWYNQLTSSMVKAGEWADTDDYYLIDALYTLDACCIEDVDWDSLLEHRSGDVCIKRWKQMSNHIGEPGQKASFVEKVEILSKRYSAEMIEPREIWDNKPRVP